MLKQAIVFYMTLVANLFMMIDDSYPSRATARYALPRRNVTTKKVSACREPTSGGQAAVSEHPKATESFTRSTVYGAVMV